MADHILKALEARTQISRILAAVLLHPSDECAGVVHRRRGGPAIGLGHRGVRLERKRYAGRRCPRQRQERASLHLLLAPCVHRSVRNSGGSCTAVTLPQIPIPEKRPNEG